VSYPLQWLAYWPLLRISLARRDADGLRNQVGGLMQEDQQPMPHGIAEHLRRIAMLIERGETPDAFAYAEVALRAAEQAGYA
jgi:hypothetical protein